jgi:hypothetical protein
MNPAASERLRKIARPQDYCIDATCLWNEARSGPCERHSPARLDPERVAAIGVYSMAGEAPAMTEPRGEVRDLPSSGASALDRSGDDPILIRRGDSGVWKEL